MADVKLAAIRNAADPEALAPQLARFFADPDPAPEIDSTRLEPPIAFWRVYRQGEVRVVFKALFQAATYEQYVGQLHEHYPERIDRPDHPLGGIVLAPEINGILWRFPFDPRMPRLHRCLDAEWISAALGRTVTARLVAYDPELDAILAYRDADTRKTIAFGKATPRETCGMVFAATEALWHSPARIEGKLKIPKPLAFRPEADLLLQARVYGKPLLGNRNRAVFAELVRAAGETLAAMHATDIPFGPERNLEKEIMRVRAGLDEVALTAPPIYPGLKKLVEQLEVRAGRGRPSPLVPSHGDYKYDQLLKHRHQYVLIDFEYFCQAEPGLDLGLFCAYLSPTVPEDWREGAAAERLRAEFLAAYERASVVAIDFERLGLWEATLLGVRALSFVWGQSGGWALRASQLVDLAFERLVSPEVPEHAKGSKRQDLRK